MAGEKPLIVAHRGSSGRAPENTIAAFRQAITDGADMIELDVRMTKDLELVVLHDQSVNRTTTGKGKIWNLTLSQVQAFDAGSWFSSTFAGERIPTLRDVLHIIPSHVNLNIEVKTDGERRKGTIFDVSLLSLIRETSFARRVIVSSFDNKFLQRFHGSDPNIRLGALYLSVRDIGKRPSTLARKVGATVFVCSVAQLRKGFAEDTQENNILLACYGVNSAKQLEKSLKFGAELIVTDYPKEMKKLL